MDAANADSEGEGTVTLAGLLPTLENQPKRADILSLKLRLAALLPPDHGQQYWVALVDFVTGKINRDELAIVMKRTIGHYSEAVQLHNALILSILYNTTRPSLPPPSIRHAGWHKRHRDKDGFKLEDRDPKRRRIKQSVMAIGKRERADLKMLGIGSGKKESDKDRERANQRALTETLDSRGPEIGKDGLPVTLASSSAQPSLQQDYLRCMKAPLCCESRMLPDSETLKDRMSLLAFDSGLGGGADSKAAALGVQAVEMHLKGMISSVVSLIRSNRSKGKPNPSRQEIAALVAQARSNSTKELDSANDDLSPSLVKPEITLTDGLGKKTIPLNGLGDDADRGGTPKQTGVRNGSSGFVSSESYLLSANDFSGLFDLAPHLLSIPHVAAVERLYAIPSNLLDSDSDEDYSSDEAEGDPSTRSGVEGAATSTSTSTGGKGRTSGKTPTLRTISRTNSRKGSRSGRPGSRGGRSNSNGTNGAGPSNASPGGSGLNGVVGGREQFLVDHSAVAMAIPLGHPDVAHPRMVGLPTPPNGGTPLLASSSMSLPPLGSGGGTGSGTGTRSRSGTLMGNGGSHPSLSLSQSGAVAMPSGQLSPKTLRSQLFPELDDSASASASASAAMVVDSPLPLPAGPHSPQNETDTDAASESEDERGGGGGGAGGVAGLSGSKLGKSKNGNGTSAAAAGGGGGGGGSNGGAQGQGQGQGERNAKKVKRKLWEVVDSARLLEGVLS
ncbi:hypothetical protein T439DRAFT_320637 [Meredithblackwellia eburnea MCA 4105]